MNLRCDIAIVGGGMVGATLGALLVEQGWRVAVVEPHPPALPPPERRDLRVSALARDAQALLARIGAWDDVAAHAQPYVGMEVWDALGDGYTRFSAADLGEPDLGHIVENRRLQLASWRRFITYPHALPLAPACAASLLDGRDETQLELEDGRLLNARLVVGADGGNSRIRAWTGLRTVGWGYDQKTIVGNLASSLPHRDRCWQRFTPTGPVAFLPLPEGECSLAWHTTTRHAEALLGLDDDAFCAELEVASGGILGTFAARGSRGAFPLRLEHALAYHAGRVVLVGDAAHTIHPLAGQGVNLGLRDAAALAAALHGCDDPGDPAALAAYQRRRQPDNLAMLLLMDAFKRGFGNDRQLLATARNLGLDLADRAGPLKNAVMRRALGLGNRVR